MDGLIWSEFGRSRQTLAEIGPKLAAIGPISRNRQALAEVRPNVARVTYNSGRTWKTHV